MRLHWILPIVVLAGGLALSAPAAVLAQDGSTLSKKEAKKLLKENGKSLGRARKAARRDDATAVTEQATRYAQNQERLNRALAAGEVDERDALEVARRVDEATLKHIPVLQGLLGTVPEQARPGIERALQTSLTGHDAATQAILNRGQVSLPAGLTDRTARDATEKNDALLDHARRSGKHIEVLEGLLDTVPEAGRPGIERALQASQQASREGLNRSIEQYAANIGAMARAMEMGEVAPGESASVYDRVDRSTRRHIGVLEGLLGKVPEQARAGIERALAASQKGNQVARAALARTPAAGVSAGRPGSAGPPSGAGGPPGGAGGGPPAGKPPGGPPGGKPPGGPPK